ncbi:Wzz/FepE/Etk N-terminal domain-containing protein [Aliarcobacter butzleri]|uniref:Wzz/FepE/Etk N-terminal domain-containing protein n=1 Tax=Aliarcobacter butzleri TaxID=28197 RepID=UPI00125F2969|nr:Wzz/FepE/Etk N-terminal domain-containing protein [Aliarcobacter butzleri]MCT7626096.1 Wzz/FepE/Etk N-terminal domain-containing protein [Aliarcobacter butzleri]MCT7644185.1 Wzz/FepE/Etk N-terminal domain-containing protein [Aliarcobacter butzleri]
MQNQKYLQEDEIDLKELFKTIWSYKKFILIFTFIVTVLSIIYVSLKTPVYEVKSVIKIGSIADVPLENSNILEKNIRVIFGLDNNSFSIKEDEGIVTGINIIKNATSLLEVTTEAFTNEKAILKQHEVLEYLQDEYKYKIDEFIFKTNLNIKNLEGQIKYINEVKKVQKEESIDFLNRVDLVLIENKLNFNREKLSQYQENINNILKKRSSNDTQNMLSAMEILNYQSLILNLQNQIENLNKEKQNILVEKIPNIKRELEYNIKNELEDILNRIELEKLKLTNKIAKNSEFVGSILVNEHPIKPKKSLIVVVSFVTGFILSIFLVFFIKFVNNIKKEEK